MFKMIDKELAKIDLELRREANAAAFDRHFNLVHVPTKDRCIKIDGKYKILDCHCEYCKLGK